MTNLYWAVYKNLEKEVIRLSDYVHFDDEQLTIYSVKIAELLIRCAVEIESISKDLYIRLGGTMPEKRDLYFDTDCLELLEEHWLLSKKKVILAAPNFYFQVDENKVLTPLQKANRRGTSGADWKRAYQAVKHDRVKNLSKGSLKNLIRGLAGLFILNIYYKDEVYNLEKDSKATDFPINMGSDLFAIKLHRWFYYDGQHNYGKKEDFDECIYLTKYTDKSLKKNKEATEEMHNKQRELFFKHPKFIKYLENNKINDYKGKNIMCDVLGKEDYMNIIRIASQNQIEVIKSTEYEAVVNKNSL